MGSTSLEMAFRMRSTKFRHVYGSPYRKEQCFENVRITRNAHDSNFCAVNPKNIAVVTESAGGGSFLVLPIDKPGRIDINVPKVCGHSGAIMDVKWSPFNDDVIASCSDDSSIKIWEIPNGGLVGNLSDWSLDLHGHTRKVTYMDWHPTAENVLLSVGLDFKCVVWNVEQAEPVNIIDCHNDTIFSMSWNNDGSLFSTTCKDKHLRIIDPRMGNVAVEAEGHGGTKSSKCVFIKDNRHIFTAGFSKTSERQYALWDVRKMNKYLVRDVIDYDSGILLPYYDPDLNIVYLAGKGNGNIRYYEIASEEPYVHFLNAYQSSTPQRSLGMMPKRGCDVSKCEVLRFYKLHAAKNLIEPISMICPRKSDKFQEDIYPPTHGTIPSLGPDEWISGQNRDPILVSVADGNVLNAPKITTSKAVQKQDSALNAAPTITTYKAVNKQNQDNQRSAPRRANTIASETFTHNNNINEPASIRNIKRLSTNEDFVSIRSYEHHHPEQPTLQTQSEPEDSRSPFMQIKETVKRNLEVKPTESSPASVYEKERERIRYRRPIGKSSSHEGINVRKSLFENEKDILDWQEETLNRPKVMGLPPVSNNVKNTIPSSPILERSLARSLKKQAQQRRKGDAENYNPEEELNPSFNQAKRYVQKQSTGETARPKSMVDIDTSKLEEELAAFRQASVPKHQQTQPVLQRQRSLEKDYSSEPMSYSQQKRHEKPSMPIYQQPSRQQEPQHESTVSPFPITRRSYEPPPSPEEVRRRPPKAGSSSPYSQRRDFRPTEVPLPIDEHTDITKFTHNRPSYPKLKQETIVTAKPFVPFDIQPHPSDKRREPTYSQPHRISEKPSQPMSMYRQTSVEKQVEDDEMLPNFSQAKRNFESKEESPDYKPRISKQGSLSPFAKRREVRSSEIPNKEKSEYVSPFSNRASYPQSNQDNIISRPFVPFEEQTSQDFRQPSTKRMFDNPPPSPESLRASFPSLFNTRKPQHSQQVNVPPTTQQYQYDNHHDSFMKKDKIRSFDYQPVQKVEPFQPFSDNRRGSSEKHDINYRTSEERSDKDKFVSKVSFSMNSKRNKEVSSSPTTELIDKSPSYPSYNRSSFPPVSSKRFDPVIAQTYENDGDIAAWEEEALRHYDSRPPRPQQTTQKHRPVDRRSGSTSPKVFLKEKNPPPPPSPTSEVGDFTERKALFEAKTPSPAESPAGPSRVEKRVWSPTSPIYKEPPSSNGIGSDSDLKKAYFRQQDEIRQLQEQINLKDKRIRQLEEELKGIRETSCGPGESNC